MARETGDSTLSATGGELLGQPPGTFPYLFLVLQGHRPLASPVRFALLQLDEIKIGRGPARPVSTSLEGGVRRASFQTDDPWLSSSHARVTRVMGRHVLEDLGSKNGTFVDGVAAKRVELSDGDLVQAGHCLFLFREGLSASGASLAVFEPAGAPAGPGPSAVARPGEAARGLTTLLPEWGEALSRLARVAASDIPVVLQGETGTGKEVLARAIHEVSARKGEFVAVNCGALPRDLVEAELFGHRRGAFSGATEDRPGLLRSADGGTLLLDEIGDMPLPAQTALLRALQEREVRPVGATRASPVDLRVIAATHRDLDGLVHTGQFRADLFARLAGHVVHLPPLRERREDIGVFLADALAEAGGRRAGGREAAPVTLSPAAARALVCHSWPGNVRELHKCVSTALVLSEEGAIDVGHLPAALQGAARTAKAARESEEATQKRRLALLLREHGGNLSAVARALGKARVQVQRWVKRYGLDAETYRR